MPGVEFGSAVRRAAEIMRQHGDGELRKIEVPKWEEGTFIAPNGTKHVVRSGMAFDVAPPMRGKRHSMVVVDDITEELRAYAPLSDATHPPKTHRLQAVAGPDPAAAKAKLWMESLPKLKQDVHFVGPYRIGLDVAAGPDVSSIVVSYTVDGYQHVTDVIRVGRDEL